jgi:hypothetical protein
MKKYSYLTHLVQAIIKIILYRYSCHQPGHMVDSPFTVVFFKNGIFQTARRNEATAKNRQSWRVQKYPFVSNGYCDKT